METILLILIQILLVPLLSPFFIGLTRKVKAKLQNRNGASPFQPYKDFWKLFHKDEVISVDASWIFKAAPYLIFASTIVIGTGIPLLTTFITNNPLSDFLVIVYIIALGTFFIALAGIDTGGSFGGFASSREMVVSALTEGGLILSLLTLALISHSTNLNSIAITVSSLQYLDFAPVILAFLSFYISILAETARYPFDNPATHLELTMIHEAMILEYSGKRLALMEWASANKYFIFIALGANLFFPWGIASTMGLPALGMALLILVGKVSLFCISIAVIESSIAKLRFFKLPGLLFTSLVFSIIALGLLI